MHGDLKSYYFYYLKELSPLLYIILPLNFFHCWWLSVDVLITRSTRTHTNMEMFLICLLDIKAVKNASDHPKILLSHWQSYILKMKEISQLPVHVLGKDGERSLYAPNNDAGTRFEIIFTVKCRVICTWSFLYVISPKGQRSVLIPCRVWCTSLRLSSTSYDVMIPS